MPPLDKLRRLLSRVASTDKMGIKNPATSIVAAFADKGGQRQFIRLS